MKKYLVETYYTCTFKTVHSLNELNEKSMSDIDDRDDGTVEVIEVKLNNRKTKKIGKESQKVKENNQNVKVVNETIDKQMNNLVQNKPDIQSKIKSKLGSRFKMPDRRKDTFKKLRSVNIKYIFILENITMEKLVKYLLIRIKKVS